MTMRLLTTTLLLVAAASVGAAVRKSNPDERTLANDNRSPAGVLRGTVLTLRLEARVGTWHPNGDDAPGAAIPAFAEEGHALEIPGPLIRVRAGTEIAVTVRNRLVHDTLVVQGLHDRTGAPIPAAALVGIRLTPGEVREVRFHLDAPGTYYYWGTTTGREINFRTGEDAQLTGAIVVDPAQGPIERDRILVVGMWTDTIARAYVERKRILAVVNGRSWPNTERLVYDVGDTVRWRVINASGDNHPLHLHGFFFRVDSRGDGISDSTYRTDSGERGVTESMSPGYTMSMSFVPDRPGHWLFHCHVPEHIGMRGPLGMPPDPVQLAAKAHDMNHAMGLMNGLVVGVDVRPGKRAPAPAIAAGNVRRLRLLVRRNAGGSDAAPFYSFAFQNGTILPPMDSGLHIGPPLVLTLNEPVSITIMNTIAEPISLHWHGIELESYYDGVGGFSGTTDHIAPPIAPGDSFVAQFTPPRAGTFIYHTHVDEERQEPAGLAGALIVLDHRETWDPTRDHPVLITSPWSWEEGRTSVLVNGDATPPPLVLRAGVTHRFRIINMTTRRPALRLELRRDTTLLAWRELAKDGADLPAARRVGRPAVHQISIGETYDVEITPELVGDEQLEVILGGKISTHPVLATLPIRVVRE